jgi:hypothetical protein
MLEMQVTAFLAVHNPSCGHQFLQNRSTGRHSESRSIRSGPRIASLLRGVSLRRNARPLPSRAVGQSCVEILRRHSFRQRWLKSRFPTPIPHASQSARN